MQKELQKKMQELHMVSPGDKVLVGVSGGADSVCLLLALYELREEMDFSIEAVHVEHGIRGAESLRDADYVKDLCERLDVPYQVYSVDVPEYAEEAGVGLEEAARKLRYEVFERLALEMGAKVALAHHKEDNAETILFQLVRGSSLAGLCGMQPVRKEQNGVCYIRPLLCFHREEIENFLETYDMDWCTDSTNAELEYSRNFLRAKVIPDLTQVNAQAVEHINQAAAHLTEMKAYLDSETERLWSQIATVDDKITLDIEKLQQLPVVMQRQIAYKAIVETANRKKDITSAHVDDLLELSKGQSGKRISLPYGMTAWKEFTNLHVSVMEEDEVLSATYQVFPEVLEEILVGESDIVFAIGDGGETISCRILKKGEELLEIPRKTYTKWLDYDKIKQGFCIRTRRSGDYFISDAKGHRKKLKQYFIDEKIPVSQRDKMWLITKENEVLWVVGGRISEDVKVTPETKYILEFTYDGGKEDE